MREKTFADLYYTRIEHRAITYVHFKLLSHDVDAQHIVDDCRDKVPFTILKDEADLWSCLRAILCERCLEEVRLPEAQNPLSRVVRNTTMPKQPPTSRLDLLSYFASTLNFQTHQIFSMKYGLAVKGDRQIAELLNCSICEIKRRRHWLSAQLDAATREYGLNLLSLLPGGDPAPGDLTQILYSTSLQQYAEYLLCGNKKIAQAIVKSVFDEKESVDPQGLAKRVLSACEKQVLEGKILNEKLLNASVGDLPQGDNEWIRQVNIEALAKQAKEEGGGAKLTEKMVEQILRLAMLGQKPSQIRKHFDNNISEGVLSQLLVPLVQTYANAVKSEMVAEINAYFK